MSETLRIAKVYICNNYFTGIPKLTDFQVVEETLGTLNEGDYLVEAKFIRISPDPSEITPNSTPKAFQLARIVESRNPSFYVDDFVVGDFGWRTHTIVRAGTIVEGLQPYVLPEIGPVPKSYGVGLFGVPGIAAYFGLLKVCEVKEGDVIVVSSAAGAVGSCAGQIARIKGCKIIGITSSEEKCAWLKELHFDHCINYKTDDITTKLKEYAPEGVDCYFDNVGGEISSAVIYEMKQHGRICINGATSLYYNEEKKSERSAVSYKNENGENGRYECESLRG
ncbi:prostaglandin reductase 1-like isoform X2 [Photinus pyralis]|uniref:prostaglandin reductase 1-like isoform X2 n=1 Tax=Photinus pyralis TaxID=7054 RepID=UPI0012674370|nr:prostaglandin reductase 1-like isoform X2 [Photinus pyralis]